MSETVRVTYNPHVFDQPDAASALAIAVTPEDGLSTEQRIEAETPYLAEMIGRELDLQPGQLVLDYGCGPGRVARAIIERWGVRVLGVDLSLAMRLHAPSYVGSASFSVVSNELLGSLLAAGLRVDAAIAVWVLQHCVRPTEDITALARALKPKGRLFVFNNFHRAVPTLQAGWVNDQMDIQAALRGRFNELSQGIPDPLIGARLAAQTFWWTGEPMTE